MATGLVLNGGGGKGAYQIGVWKYLREKDIKFDYISGTSAGALNSALIALNDFEKAEKLWLNLKPEQVREIDTKQLTEIIKNIVKEIPQLFFLKKSRKSYLLARELPRYLGFLLRSKNVSKIFISKGIYSTKPLEELIDKNIKFNQFPITPNVFITVVKNDPLYLIFGSKDYINFTASNKLTKKKLLLASSAIPLIFPNSDIGSVQYSDGGIPSVGDNSPVFPLYIRGCDKIIVIHCIKDGKTDKSRYSKSRITHIAPSKDIGGLRSTLKFEGKFSEELIELGYEDARKALNRK